ncbi:sugar transferase [Sphaerobacter sp.]|uniref:sugar transferase n=1 Tax=Sphaerobacter sp. TaxID=2099654 RepID=UPI0025E0C6A6|nr:sugar transferase [Sphaerobacter sp.]
MMQAQQAVEIPRAVVTHVDQRRLRYYATKRCIDVVLSSAALVLLSPVMLVIALAIKLDSRGPVIFAHERVGARMRRRGTTVAWEIRPFRFYKFRSMVHNADESLHRAHIAAYASGQVQRGPGKGGFKLTGDPRITRVGRFLRATSLDELPQLVNVLKGDMSLVGPRPVPPYEVEHYESWHFERLAALPGITGLWQVTGRCALTFDEMIALDLEYVRNQSTVLDLKILARTVPAVLRGTGAG